MCAAIAYRFILERRYGDDWVEVGQYTKEAYAEEAMSERIVAERVRNCRYEARLAQMWGDEFYCIPPQLYGCRYRIRSLKAWVPDGDVPIGDDVERLDDYEIDRSPVWFVVLRAVFRLLGVSV